jgi:hypothetical protein
MGWSPIQGVLPTVYKIYNFGINSECEQARQPIPPRWKKKKKENIVLVHWFSSTIESL